MKKINVKSFLTLDYAMIDEALRRLQDGTCCLLGEDKMSAMDLFNRMRMALQDHIFFENQVLPMIAESKNNTDTKDLCLKMKVEHECLSGLLEAAGHELVDEHPIAFRAVLAALKIGLQAHVKLETIIPYDEWIESLNDEALTRIETRASDGFLGAE